MSKAVAPSADSTTMPSKVKRRREAARCHGSRAGLAAAGPRPSEPTRASADSMASPRLAKKPRHGCATIERRWMGGALGPTPGLALVFCHGELKPAGPQLNRAE